MQRGAAQQLLEVVADAVEHAAVEIDEVHLVDGQDEVIDAEQPRNPRVALGLDANAVARVDQQDGEVGGGRAGRHVARVLLVAGRVGQDELAPRRGEVAVRDVDRDSLLPLGFQPVGEQREVDRTGIPVLRRFLDRADLIFVDRPRIVEQPADERALPIVDAAGGADAEEPDIRSTLRASSAPSTRPDRGR